MPKPPRICRLLDEDAYRGYGNEGKLKGKYKAQTMRQQFGAVATCYNKGNVRSRIMVTQTVEAIYDGKVLRPKKRLAIKPNTPVQLTIRAVTPKTKKKKSALKVIESLKVDAPANWSEDIETYLQTQKRSHGS